MKPLCKDDNASMLSQVHLLTPLIKNKHINIPKVIAINALYLNQWGLEINLLHNAISYYFWATILSCQQIFLRCLPFIYIYIYYNNRFLEKNSYKALLFVTNNFFHTPFI